MLSGFTFCNVNKVSFRNCYEKVCERVILQHRVVQCLLYDINDTDFNGNLKVEQQ